jgi:hypothetical protein
MAPSDYQPAATGTAYGDQWPGQGENLGVPTNVHGITR